MEGLGLVVVCFFCICFVGCILEDRKNTLEDREFENWKPSNYWGELPSDSSFYWNEEDLGPFYPLNCSVEDCTYQSASGCGKITTNLEGALGDKKISNAGDCSDYLSHEAVIRWEREEEDREKKMIDDWELEEKEEYNNSLLAIEDMTKRYISKL